MVLALAVAGAEEVVEDEDDSLELEGSEKLELDCVILALVMLESEDSVVKVVVVSSESEEGEAAKIEERVLVVSLELDVG